MKFPLQSVYNWYRNLIRNPKYRWWVVLGSLLYFVSPLDLISDFIPFVGELDDAVIMTLLVSEVSQMMIEGFKSRKNATTTEVSTADSTPTTEASTIDVEAVSVK